MAGADAGSFDLLAQAPVPVDQASPLSRRCSRRRRVCLVELSAEHLDLIAISIAQHKLERVNMPLEHRPKEPASPIERRASLRVARAPPLPVDGIAA